MRKRGGGFLRLIGAAVAFSGLASSGTFYSFGPDDFGAGRVFSEVPSGVPSFPLGDGSLAFNGGLVAVSSSVFYTIANDSLMNSSLMSFTLGGPGTLTLVAPLGVGFNGGLAYDPDTQSLYAISNDPLGNSTLNQADLLGNVTSLGPLGVGFYGGLTFNPLTGLLYGFQADGTGAQRVFNSITPAVSPLVNSLFTLGDGSISFNGGVAFDPAAGLFYAISNDFLANSTLHSFTLAGETSLQAAASNFGSGYINVGLTSTTAAIPEPSSWTYLLSAAGLALGRRFALRRRARKPAANR